MDHSSAKKEKRENLTSYRRRKSAIFNTHEHMNCLSALVTVILLTIADGLMSAKGPHLYVLVHGYLGSPSDLRYFSERLSATSTPGAPVVIHQATANSGKTHDGVINGGERLFEEIVEVVGRVQPSDLSLLGNSLGGLYCRFAASRILEKFGVNDDGSIPFQKNANVSLNTFITTASPWLGIAGQNLAGAAPFPRSMEVLGGAVMGKTIRDLERGNDLVFKMCRDVKYLNALALFSRRIAVGNGYNCDAVVATDTSLFLSPGSESIHERVDLGVPGKVGGKIEGFQTERGKKWDQDGPGGALDSEESGGVGGEGLGEELRLDTAKTTTTAADIISENISCASHLDSLGWLKVVVDLREELTYGAWVLRRLPSATTGYSESPEYAAAADRMTSGELSERYGKRNEGIVLPNGHNLLVANEGKAGYAYLYKGGRKYVDAIVEILLLRNRNQRRYTCGGEILPWEAKEKEEEEEKAKV